MNVLIAYASRYGSTEEIAEAVAKAFRAGGARAEVRPAFEVRDLAPWDAAVLGTPLYYGKPLVGATRFADEHAEALAKMPTAVFLVGLALAHPTEAIVRKTATQTKALVEAVQPTDVGLFGGALRYADLNWWTRLMMRLMKVREGDLRNWPLVERWAADILARFRQGR